MAPNKLKRAFENSGNKIPSKIPNLEMDNNKKLQEFYDNRSHYEEALEELHLQLQNLKSHSVLLSSVQSTIENAKVLLKGFIDSIPKQLQSEELPSDEQYCKLESRDGMSHKLSNLFNGIGAGSRPSAFKAENSAKNFTPSSSQTKMACSEVTHQNKVESATRVSSPLKRKNSINAKSVEVVFERVKKERRKSDSHSLSPACFEPVAKERLKPDHNRSSIELVKPIAKKADSVTSMSSSASFRPFEKERRISDSSSSVEPETEGVKKGRQKSVNQLISEASFELVKRSKQVNHKSRLASTRPVDRESPKSVAHVSSPELTRRAVTERPKSVVPVARRASFEPIEKESPAPVTQTSSSVSTQGVYFRDGNGHKVYFSDAINFMSPLVKILQLDPKVNAKNLNLTDPQGTFNKPRGDVKPLDSSSDTLRTISDEVSRLTDGMSLARRTALISKDNRENDGKNVKTSSIDCSSLNQDKKPGKSKLVDGKIKAPKTTAPTSSREKERIQPEAADISKKIENCTWEAKPSSSRELKVRLRRITALQPDPAFDQAVSKNVTTRRSDKKKPRGLAKKKEDKEISKSLSGENETLETQNQQPTIEAADMRNTEAGKSLGVGSLSTEDQERLKINSLKFRRKSTSMDVDEKEPVPVLAPVVPAGAESESKTRYNQRPERTVPQNVTAADEKVKSMLCANANDMSEKMKASIKKRKGIAIQRETSPSAKIREPQPVNMDSSKQRPASVDGRNNSEPHFRVIGQCSPLSDSADDIISVLPSDLELEDSTGLDTRKQVRPRFVQERLGQPLQNEQPRGRERCRSVGPSTLDPTTHLNGEDGGGSVRNTQLKRSQSMSHLSQRVPFSDVHYSTRSASKSITHTLYPKASCSSRSSSVSPGEFPIIDARATLPDSSSISSDPSNSAASLPDSSSTSDAVNWDHELYREMRELEEEILTYRQQVKRMAHILGHLNESSTKLQEDIRWMILKFFRKQWGGRQPHVCIDNIADLVDSSNDKGISTGNLMSPISKVAVNLMNEEHIQENYTEVDNLYRILKEKLKMDPLTLLTKSRKLLPQRGERKCSETKMALIILNVVIRCNWRAQGDIFNIMKRLEFHSFRPDRWRLPSEPADQTFHQDTLRTVFNKLLEEGRVNEDAFDSALKHLVLVISNNTSELYHILSKDLQLNIDSIFARVFEKEKFGVCSKLSDILPDEVFNQLDHNLLRAFVFAAVKSNNLEGADRLLRFAVSFGTYRMLTSKGKDLVVTLPIFLTEEELHPYLEFCLKKKIGTTLMEDEDLKDVLLNPNEASLTFKVEMQRKPRAKFSFPFLNRDLSKEAFQQIVIKVLKDSFCITASSEGPLIKIDYQSFLDYINTDSSKTDTS